VLNYKFCPRCNEDALHADAKCVVCRHEPAQKKTKKPKGFRAAPTSFSLRRKSLLAGIGRVQETAAWD